MQTVIRNIKRGDYEQIRTLWLNADGVGLNDYDDSRERFEVYIARNPSTSFVAELGGEIVGVILCGHDGRRGYIYHTAVKVELRGQGIGSELVDAAANALKAVGIVKAGLVAFKRNESGNEFWEKRGFTVREDLLYRNKVIAA
jgi:ribosomal protein S18 acetylase RimI-like enzyme